MADDTILEDNLTCPYCGYVFADSWELDGDGGRIDCEQCDREFKWERVVDIRYTGRALDSSITQHTKPATEERQQA